jgi:hypothetical protein
LPAEQDPSTAASLEATPDTPPEATGTDDV